MLNPTSLGTPTHRSPDVTAPPSHAHIFISYKHEDRLRARALADALETFGWHVWWDRDVKAGQTYRKVIGDALDAAGCVIVLWTATSVDSEWVQEEAQQGKERGVLVPILLDDVRPPLGFGQVQAANLVEWNEQPDDTRLHDVLSAVEAVYGQEATHEADVPPFCRKCGTKTLTATRFCRSCGHELAT